jgi:hypothetical protein
MYIVFRDLHCADPSLMVRTAGGARGQIRAGPASVRLDVNSRTVLYSNVQTLPLGYEDYDAPIANLVSCIKTLLQRQVPTSYNVGAFLQPHFRPNPWVIRAPTHRYLLSLGSRPSHPSRIMLHQHSLKRRPQTTGLVFRSMEVICPPTP